MRVSNDLRHALRLSDAAFSRTQDALMRQLLATTEDLMMGGGGSPSLGLEGLETASVSFAQKSVFKEF